MEPGGETALAYVVPVFLILAVGYFLPGALGGAGLLAGQGWARVVIICLSFLILLMFPIGTVLGAFGLWTLLRDARPQPAAPQSDAPTVAAPAPTPPMSRALGLLLAMAGVGSGFIVFIGVGFRLDDRPAPGPIDTLLLPALGVLAATLTVGIHRLIKGTPEAPVSRGLNPIERARMRAESEKVVREHRERLERLSADPVRRKYVPMMEAGDYWSDEQIEYDLDPDARVTCEHLQPVEAAMRAAGVTVKPSMAMYADAHALIDEAELARRFPDPRIGYSEFELGGRHYEDNPMAQIACAEHRSAINCLHPLDGKPGTPTFPGSS